MSQAEPGRRIAPPIVLFLIASTLAAPLLGMAQDQGRLDPDLLRLTTFSTAVGAAVTVLIFRNRLTLPPVTRRTSFGAVAATVAISGLIGLVMSGLAAVQHAPWVRADPTRLIGGPLLFLGLQVAGAWAEEVGWRGLVQPLLERRWPLLAAALVTGVLFAIGHAFMIPAVGAAAFLVFSLAAIAVSVTLAAVTFGRSIPMRIAVATGLHFLMNMTTFFLFSDGDGSARYFADLAAAATVAAVVSWVIVARTHRAGPTE